MTESNGQLVWQVSRVEKGRRTLVAAGCDDEQMIDLQPGNYRINWQVDAVEYTSTLTIVVSGTMVFPWAYWRIVARQRQTSSVGRLYAERYPDVAAILK